MYYAEKIFWTTETAKPTSEKPWMGLIKDYADLSKSRLACNMLLINSYLKGQFFVHSYVTISTHLYEMHRDFSGNLERNTSNMFVTYIRHLFIKIPRSCIKY